MRRTTPLERRGSIRGGLPALLLALVLAPAVAAAQAAPTATPPAKETAAPKPPTVDLTTPRRSLQNLVGSVAADDDAKAAQSLDLTFLPENERESQGPVLARELALILNQKLHIDWSAISDQPQGPTGSGGSVVVGRVPLENTGVPVVLVRVDTPQGRAWKVSSATVQAVPRLYAARSPTWISEHLPPWFSRTRFAGVDAWQWVGLGVSLVVAVFFALVVGAGLRRLALALARRTKPKWDDLLVEDVSGPGRLLIGIGVFGAVSASLHLAVPAQHGVNVSLRTALVVAFTWLAMRGVRFMAQLLGERMERRHRDPLAVRAAQTQIAVLRRVVNVVVIVVGASLLLLEIPGLRSLGTSLLASAGVAGVILGLAAQRTIGTLFAGIQLSITQPVRIGDVVVVEGEWGTIEEITLTYVVLKIWDLRRLVLPITYFLEKPIQNWTKTGMDILGTVFVYADYRVPVDAVRQEVDRFLKTREDWDGKVSGLVVTNATAQTLEMRALLSAPDSSTAWNLRCALREDLVTFLQTLDGGRYLPRSRVELEAQPGGGGPDPDARGEEAGAGEER